MAEPRLLGAGLEGEVWLDGGMVQKRFFPGVLDDVHVEFLRRTLEKGYPHLPDPSWTKDGERWTMSYPWEPTGDLASLGPRALAEFLAFCFRRGLVCANFKRANIRERAGKLFFIDIGRDTMPFRSGWFRDACARGWLSLVRGWNDQRLAAFTPALRDETVLAELDGFAEFYREVVLEAVTGWLGAAASGGAGAVAEASATPAGDPVPAPATAPRREEVSLLVRACSMEDDVLEAKVRHLVGQLCRPADFTERVLLLDPFPGPFLREYRRGNYSALFEEAERLRDAGLVDQVLVGPADREVVRAVNDRWFGLDCGESHTASGVPVACTLWGFEQLRTRYVLQMDLDVLIGRRDLGHDYLADMIEAAAGEDVMGVTFNIPHDPACGFRPYEAPPGRYVPEVRCGLIDLERLRAGRPYPNRLVDGRLELSWFRSVERFQQEHGRRTRRGGDSRTWYVHPPNALKRDPDLIERLCDLAEQNLEPESQWGRWDVENVEQWRYPVRTEEVVVLLKGRDTPPERLRRCLRSLELQDWQGWGAVVVDDASTGSQRRLLLEGLEPFAGRITLIRNWRRRGHLQNEWRVMHEVCVNPESAIVILDLDDALASPRVLGRLREEYRRGADAVWADMFRPDKPLKLYAVHPLDPRGRRDSGNVWVHLRSFRRRLYDRVRREDLMIDGQWIPVCTDYALMVPIAEAARRPVCLEEYMILHERSTPVTPEGRRGREAVIREVMTRGRR